MLAEAGETTFPETLTNAVVSGNMRRMPGPASENSAVANRVRQHRANSGLIRVEVEVPTSEDALAVRRFAQARRRTEEKASPPIPDTPPDPPAPARDELVAILADMDAARQVIALMFGQALAQATEPDMLARGRRVALNFADAVAQRRRDTALRDNDNSQ